MWVLKMFYESVLYHFVPNESVIQKILEDGFIKVGMSGAVCMTRCTFRTNYRITLNKTTLQYNNKIVPYCFFYINGFYNMHSRGYTELEERCYNNISVKHILRIEILINENWHIWK